MSVTELTLNEVMKEVWKDGVPLDATLKDHPFMGMVKRSTNRLVGEYFVLPIKYGNNQAVTPSIANSIARATAASIAYKQFQIPRTVLYNTALIDGVTAKVTKGNKGSAIDAIEAAMESAPQAQTDGIASMMFRSGYGKIGVIGATTSLASKTIVLSNPEDARFFERDMRIIFGALETSGTLRDASDFVTVVSVDPDAGTVLTDAPTDLSTSITGIALADVIFPQDWRQSAATPVRQVAFGVEAWNPPVAPTATLFCNVDRSVAPARLGGMRISNLTENRPLDEFLRRMTARAFRNGKRISHMFLNPERWQDLADLRDGFRPVTVKGTDIDIGYDVLEMSSVAGKVLIVPEPDCPSDRVHGMKLDEFELMSVGDLVHVIDDDGKWANRSATADSLEVRFRSIFNVGCMDPSSQIYGTLA